MAKVKDLFVRWILPNCGCLAPAIVIGLVFVLVMLSLNEGGLRLASNLKSVTVPEPYKTIFEKAGAKWQVDPNFIAAIFSIEHGMQNSGYKSWPNSQGPWAVSNAGAHGPFQFMPGTWSGKKGMGFLESPNSEADLQKCKGIYIGYRQDGNDDGKADVENLWDAAFAAANKLSCGGAGGNTANEKQLKQAAFSYNKSYNYVEKVITAYYRFSASTISTIANANECSEKILAHAASYEGTPYGDEGAGGHCGPLQPTGKFPGLHLDCSGYVSRVYRELQLIAKNYCGSTKTLPKNTDIQEISANEVQAGDLIINQSDIWHAVIYELGDVTKKFSVWQSGGDADNVHQSSRNARTNQRYFRAKKCLN